MMMKIRKIFFLIFVFPALSYGEARYVTLLSTDDVFVIYGNIQKINSYSTLKDAPVKLSETIPNFTAVRFTKTGYFSITVLDNGKERVYSVFVSPVPSVHVNELIEERDWYQTQFDSGALSNCGPASCAMSISWASGKPYPVSSVRGAIGWHGDGGTTFEELIPVIKANNIDTGLRSLRNFDDIKTVIDEGSVAIILFNTDGVSNSGKDPLRDLSGKYYDDSVGHYILVKGYSINGEYIIVHDPIPSDWRNNRLRYDDGLSMIGKNRYYKTDELLAALRRRDMIVVKKQR